MIPSPTPIPTHAPDKHDTIEVKSEKSILGETTTNNSQSTLVVPADSSVNLRNAPSSTADIIMAIKQSVDVYIFKSEGEWRQIGFAPTDDGKGYWVHSKFIEGK